MTQPTIGDLIAKYREIKAYIDAEEEVLKERLKDHKAALQTISTALGVMLQSQGLQNFKTDDGTAYLNHKDGLKVDNQAEFLNFVRVNERWNMATIGLLVEPVREYLEKQTGQNAAEKETFAQQLERWSQALPPGVTLDPSVTCIIRR